MNENYQINTKGLILRVLNGLHAGAELSLVVGEYVIGSGEEDDIILEDEEVLPRHCHLKIEPESITISPLEGTVFVDAQKIETSVSLNLFQIITIGNVCFAIGPDDKKWPELSIPVHQKEIEPSKEEDQENQETKVEETSIKEQTENKKSYVKYFYILFIFIGLIITFLFFFSSAKKQKTVSIKKDRLKLAQGLIKEMGFPYIKVLKDKNGLKIEGYVETLKDKQLLLKKLKALDSNIKFHVYTNEELLIAAQDIITQIGLKGISIKVVENGKLVLKGFVSNKQKLNKLLTLLKEDIPNLSKIEYHLICLAEIEKKIKQLLTNKNISNLHVISKPSNIIIAGKLPIEKKKELEKILEIIRKEYGKDFLITKNIQFVQGGIKLNLNAVVCTGRINYIVLDGKKFFEGSILPGGYLLKKITSRRLVLEKNGENCYYNYIRRY